MELTDIPDERSYAHQQQELLAQYGCPLILLSLHTFGPIDEHYAVFKRAFQEGLERVEAALTASGAKVLYRGVQATPPGLSYGVWVIDGSGKDLKRLCVELEDTDALSQLFDLDVVEPDGRKWDRSQLGCPPRKCILCGCKRHSCAARNAHPTKVLQQTAQQILWDFFAQQDSKRLAALAAKALLYEVCTTPKPGLVDRNNNGSHKDMDLFTFLDSTAALLPYFEQAAALGQKTAGLPPEETFRLLRALGIRGEQAMFRATSGVNTHKGAIFSLGTVCAGAGRLWTPAGLPTESSSLLRQCSSLCAQAVREDLAAITPESAATVGQQLYLDYGLDGIRGELSRGLPAVAQIGLPALKKALSVGSTLEQAGVSVLLHLMAHVSDTNLIARGGLEGQHWAAYQAQDLLDRGTTDSEAVVELDRRLIRRNLSPGGCADLLAITYFLYFLTLE